ncbi:MAG TPA: Ldh family oxidoreductase, partial [Bryobacteraceae bacterium]|nr:Ldh family oxidoreductase [Bryobacteraceae bacterium]
MGAQKIAARTLCSIGTRIFDRLGSPHEESRWVAETLVNSSLRGYDSHGILRIAQYAAYLQEGVVVPGARFEILRNTRSVALVDGHRGWGQVVARKAMQLAIEKAKRSSIGTVVVRNSQHVSRLGEYPAMAVPHGMIGLAIINIFGGVEVEKVAPWGGIDPKLAPNP